MRTIASSIVGIRVRVSAIVTEEREDIALAGREPLVVTYGQTAHEFSGGGDEMT